MEKQTQKKWEEMTPSEKNRAKINLTIIAVIVVIISCICVAKCNSEDVNQEKVEKTTTNSETFKAGEIAYLTDDCVGLIDSDDFDDLMKYINAGDNTGIMNMVASGKAVKFAAGKQVKVVKIGFEFNQVRDVDATEALVWVPKDMLTHKDVNGIYNK